MCQLQFIELMEKLESTRKEERIINNFLCQAPSNIPILEILNLEQVIERLTLTQLKDFKVIEAFVAMVKLEMVLDKFYFNFFEVPQILVTKKYKKIDFQLLKSLLM